MSLALPSPLPSNFILQWAAGASYPFRAFGFLRRHNLWPLAFVAVAINILLLAGLCTATYYLIWPWLLRFDAQLQLMAGDGDAVRAAVTVLSWLMWLVLLPVVFVVSALVVLLVGQVVASPFLDLLSERVESLVLARPSAPYGFKRLLDTLFFAVGDTLWGGLYLVLIYIPMLFVGFIPGVGAVASLCCGAMLLAQEFLGMPMARHLIGYRARWALVLSNRWFCLGFGSATTLLLAVPGLNLVLLPLASVGGTLLYCDLAADGRLGVAQRSQGNDRSAV